MTNTELYINGQLVDTGGNLGVRLNRKLIDPGALNTVDAQYSYSITLPYTDRNVAAFNYASVEETRNKFNQVYNAELIIGVRIFGPGLFRLTGISGGFTGQLYMPAKKTIKDIFGALMLTDNAPYELPFLDFTDYVNLYNVAAATSAQAAIFPYILYGVLPKVPINRDANTYSARTLWDSSVKIGIADLAPAINPLIMLKHIFNSNGYAIQGTAFQDDKLVKLYQSYKNDADYVQPWNYGRHASMQIHGAWSSRTNKRTGLVGDLEQGGFQSSDQSGIVYACDFFDATNSQIIIDADPGGNVLYKEVNNNAGKTWVNCQMRIPVAGFYKVSFTASISVDQSADWRGTDPVTGIQHVGGVTDNARNDFNSNFYGMRLVRDRNTADFGTSGAVMDGTFYYDNLPQDNVFDATSIPKYFPVVDANGQINMIDAAQDQHIVLGFEFGKNENVSEQYTNPRDTTGKLAQVMVAKPATSWSFAEASDKVTRLAINNTGYWKFGKIGNFDNEGDNPNVNIPYTAGPFITGKVLDTNGNPIDPTSELAVRTAGYALNSNSGLPILATNWSVSNFIDLVRYTVPKFTGTAQTLNTTAITAFYDANKQYIGPGILAATEAINLYGALTWTNGQYWNISGVAVTNVNCSTSSNYAIDPTTTPSIRVSIMASANQIHKFLDASGAFISGFGNEAPTSTWFVTVLKTYTVPTNARFISFSWTSPTYGATAAFQFTPLVNTVYTNQLINAPTGAAYFRIATLSTPTSVITATSADTANKILSRFTLARYYTYVITTLPADNYTGYAYIHNGTDTVPLLIVPFVNGVATFSTSLVPILVVAPKLTLYLKTPKFNVDGTLTISRRIEGESVDVIDWELTDRYEIDLNNAPLNYAKRGQFNGAAADALWYAQGSANAVVWFEAGELLTIASVSSEGRYRKGGMHSTFGWASHEVDFNLSVIPFRTDIDWLKVDLRGNGTAAMDWNDTPNFSRDTIDLVQFLDAGTKTDDYIDNFCKAFNLNLSQIDDKTFSLDVKQSKTATSNVYVDLDSIATIAQRENAPLGIPSQYTIGFTIDTDEEGFVETNEDGGGSFTTGATEELVVTQTSAFSYNWYKAITKVETTGNITINLPLISKAEAWDPTLSYPDAMTKRYTDLAQRFMYYAGILPGTYQYNNEALKIAAVRNDMPGVSILNYKNELYTILYNYFTLLINGASHYTNIKGYLSALQYTQLNGSRTGKFNDDLYFIAELSGYDPYNKNQTTIKLIRKI